MTPETHPPKKPDGEKNTPDKPSVTAVLDEEAAKLFEQLHGIDTAYGKNRMAESLKEEESRQDEQRAHVIELLDLISSSLLSQKHPDRPEAERQLLDQITARILKLKSYESDDAPLLMRYRGYPGRSSGKEVTDYEVVFRNLRFNSETIAAMIRRLGPQVAHLMDKTDRTFRILASHGVQSLYMKLPSHDPSQQMHLNIALQVLTNFQKAAVSGSPIQYMRGNSPKQMPVITDENGLPDENLTLVTAVNGISHPSIRTIVKKLGDAGARDRYLGIYNALFAVKNLKGKLTKPPLEINNMIWLIADQENEPITPEQAKVAQLAKKACKNSPQSVAGTIQAVYGNDYEHIEANHLGHRLQLSTGLLDAIDPGAPDGSAMQREILTNIESRLDQVRDQVFDDLFSQEKMAAYGGDAKGGFLSTLHQSLLGMITFYKHRADAKKKMVRIIDGSIQFSNEDYETLAKDYGISKTEAQGLIRQLRSCFNASGRFQKARFGEAISEFEKYEHKIFEFLWHYLLGDIHEGDRIGFLNSLQLLITRMRQPKQAIGILLSDFTSDPKQVRYSDSKALMLCSLLIRKYDQKLIDLEITPEEILQVDEDLDEAIVRYAAWKIDRDQKRYFEKIQTVHQQLLTGLNLPAKGRGDTSLPYLFELEREAYLFFALIGGTTARSLILSAVREYGDPQTMLYQCKQRKNFMKALMKNLRVVVRAMARVGQKEDLAILDELKRNAIDLMALERSPTHQESIKRIMEWADHSAKAISARA